MNDIAKDQLKIKKPVQSLVLIPKKGKLSVVARKLYNVILHSTIAQIAEFELQSKEVPAEHLFEGRLIDLVMPIQVGQSDLRAKAKEYLQQMSEIRLDWEAPDARGNIKWTNLGLLAEAQLGKENPNDPKSDVIVRWAFPPTIFKELRHPEMYAQISIYQLAKLSTYEAVALYEICARYRTNAAGVTSIQEPLWWIKALSNKVPDLDPKTGEPKWREWRKFKDEKIKKTVAEINEQTDLNIELLEKKEGVQFAVKRKASEFLPAPNRLNPEIAESALKLGIKLTDIAALIRNGQSEVGLKAAFAKMANQDPANITRKLAYLNKILEEVNPLIAHGRAPDQQTVLPPLRTPRVEPLKVALSYKDERRAEIRKEFMQLDKPGQQAFAYEALAELKASKLTNPAMSLKVESGAWESAPILFSKMVELYAVATYSSNWGVEQSRTELA
ncbi:MAG: replication initiation protein [Burkholderiaceae bacterium]|nr:replication initiation protein [Burkholderiaceae bacterium]